MGSYSYFIIDDLVIYSTKRDVDPTVLMLFTESDRRVRDFSVEELEVICRDRELEEEDVQSLPGKLEYSTTLSIIKDRLEFSGFTLPLIKSLFERGIEEHLHDLQKRREDPFWQDNLRSAFDKGGLLDTEEQLLQELTFERWLEAVSVIVRAKLPPDIDQWPPPEIDRSSSSDLVRYIRGHSFGEGLWFPVFDFRVFMRAVVEITGTDGEVIYDLTELVVDEYVDVADDLCDWSKRQLAEEFVLNHNVIVLTEGSSDKWAIEGALKILFPHLIDHYSFMDFEGMKITGGAGPLVGTLKAFVGAGVANRIVALFDNDTAARAALRGLRSLTLPGNVRVLQYPDIEWARNYPTLGPQGVTNMDVNGLAGSLEMYYGLDILTQEDGTLCPVQWRGYEESVGKYQGELLHKNDLKARFLEKLETCQKDPTAHNRFDWSGMRAIVDLLRTAFHDEEIDMERYFV